MILLWATLIGFASARCEPTPPNGRRAPFAARAHVRGKVILEMPLYGSAKPPTEILLALHAHGLRATLLVTRTWATEHPDFIEQASKQGHEVGLWISLREDLGLVGSRVADPELGEWVSAMRKGRRTIRRLTGQTVNTLGLATLPATAEIAAEAVGFRALLPRERTLHDQPRRTRSVSKTAGRARIIGQGTYDDGCGHMLPHWSPAAIDRATSIAARTTWVRIGLPPDPLAGSLMERWAEEVIVPYQWPVLTASEMSAELKQLGTTATTAAPEIPVPKLISISEWTRVASAISSQNTLPRTPSEGVNLTEAFFALVTLLASDLSPTSVTLGRLDPPREIAPLNSRDPIQLDETQVRQTASKLLPRLRGQIPSLITIDGQTFTAAEALQVMARVFLGDAAIVTPVADPDPYAPGGGWGTSQGL